MDKDELRKRLLHYLDDLMTQEGSVDINSKEIARGFNDSLGLDVDQQKVNRAVKYIADKGYLDCRDTSGFGTEGGTKDLTIFDITAEGRDFMEGKSEKRGNLNVNIDGDIDADMVAIGQDFSQEKTVEVGTLKDVIDRTEGLSQKDKEALKKGIDRLVGELEEPNPNRNVVGSILKQIKTKGPEMLIGLTAKLLFQMFISGL